MTIWLVKPPSGHNSIKMHYKTSHAKYGQNNLNYQIERVIPCKICQSLGQSIWLYVLFVKDRA